MRQPLIATLTLAHCKGYDPTPDVLHITAKHMALNVQHRPGLLSLPEVLVP